MAKLRGLLGLVLLMIGWAVIVKGLTVAIWLGVVVAVVLVALWLWWLGANSDRGSDWPSMMLFVVTWASWALAAWVGLFFAIYIGVFAGAALGLWEITDR
jgi:hypothetical protein